TRWSPGSETESCPAANTHRAKAALIHTACHGRRRARRRSMAGTATTAEAASMESERNERDGKSGIISMPVILPDSPRQAAIKLKGGGGLPVEGVIVADPPGGGVAHRPQGRAIGKELGGGVDESGVIDGG